MHDLPEKRGVRIRERMSEFVIHIGAKEIIPAYKRIAYENKNDRIMAIQHHRSWRKLIEKITARQLVDFNRAIVKNKLILEGMLNESAYQSYTDELKTAPEKNKEAIESLGDRMADYAVFPDEFFNFDAELWLFKNTALIINWHEEFAIEITNANITGFLKDMFTLVKTTARKISHQQALEKAMELPK